MTRTNTVLASLILSLFLVCLPNQADADLPKFVYRADFRSAATIFESGFPSIGDNINMIEHVTGISCSYGPNPSTAFVATTSEEAFAEQWGGDQLWLDRYKTGPNVQIFKIRATHNFYDCYQSLLKSSRTASTAATRNSYKAVAAKYEYQKEWLVHHGVPRELIVSVKVMEKLVGNAPKLRLVREENNPNYIEADTEGNSQPFNDQGTTARSGWSFVTSRLPYLSACFASCPKLPSKLRDASSGRKNDPPPASCPTKNIVFAASSLQHKATVWDPIDEGPRERITPWKEETIIKGHVVEKPKGCTVEQGTSDEYLKIGCATNKFYDRFIIMMRAGTGTTTIVDKRFSDGSTCNIWKRTPEEIPTVHGSRNLAHYNATIQQMFAPPARGELPNSFWSEIKVYPIYPDYIEVA